jgi:hypothetical protein
MAELLTDRLAHGGVLVIKDTLAASGSFILALLLRKAVQDGQKVRGRLVESSLHPQQLTLPCAFLGMRDEQAAYRTEMPSMRRSSQSMVPKPSCKAFTRSYGQSPH